MAAVAAASLLLPSSPWAWLAAAALPPALAFAVLRAKKSSGAVCLAVCAVGLVAFARCAVFRYATVKPVEDLAGSAAEAEFTVTDVARYDASSRVTLKVTANANGAGVRRAFKTSVFLPEETASPLPGDTGRATLRFEALPRAYGNSSRVDGIYINATASGFRLTGHRRTPAAAFWRARWWIKARIERYLPYDEATLLCGLLTGDTSEMRSPVKEALRRCGLSHLTAVSGVHLSVFCFGLFYLLRKFFGRRKSALLAAPAVFLVMGVAGFSASVVRAGAMALLVLAGHLVFRRPDPLNSLGLAAAGMLLFSPYYLTDPGFLLSFAAMVGMLLLAPAIARRIKPPVTRFPLLNKTLRAALSTLICTLSASVCTFPVAVWFFGEVSLISPLLNLIMTPLAMFAMLSGSLSLLAVPLFWLTRLPLSLIILATGKISKLPFTAVYADTPWTRLFVLLALLITAVFLMARKRRPAVYVALLLVALIGCRGAYLAANSGVTRVAVMNTGGGMAVAVSRGGECAALVLGGRDAAEMFTRYADFSGAAKRAVAVIPSADKRYCSANAVIEAGFEAVAIPRGEEVLRRTFGNAGLRVLELDAGELGGSASDGVESGGAESDGRESGGTMSDGAEPDGSEHGGGELDGSELGGGTLRLFGDFTVTALALGDGAALFWETGGVTGLILAGVTASPERSVRVDLVIADSPLPAGIAADTVIFCGDRGAAAVAVDVSANGSAASASPTDDITPRVYPVPPGETVETRVKRGSFSGPAYVRQPG